MTFWHGIAPQEPPEPPKNPPIPEVRERLLSLARQLRADEIGKDDAAESIEQFVEWMWRRRAIRRAPRDSKPVTAEMRARIIQMATEHPDWTEQRIAAETGVKNQGRVSEVLAGYRR